MSAADDAMKSLTKRGTVPRRESATVTHIAEGRARLKRKKLTSEEYKARKMAAQVATGYDSTSSIWNMTTLQVVQLVMALLTDALGHGVDKDAEREIQHAIAELKELEKRENMTRIIHS